MSEHQPSERNRRLAANILAGRSPLDDQMLRTIRTNAVADLNVPPPRVLQLVDEVERLRRPDESAYVAALEKLRVRVQDVRCGNAAGQWDARESLARIYAALDAVPAAETGSGEKPVTSFPDVEGFVHAERTAQLNDDPRR